MLTVTPFEFTELLQNLYLETDRNKTSLPDIFHLSKEGYSVFREFHNHCENKSKSPGTLPALQNVYGKAHGKVGKYALPIHILNHYFKYGSLDNLPAEINADTVAKAIKWVSFLINQIKGFHAANDNSDNLTGILTKILTIAKRKQDNWLSSRDISNSLSTKERKENKSEQIKQYCYELAKMGYGEVETTPRGGIKFKAFSQRKNTNLTTEPSVKEEGKLGECSNVGSSVDSTYLHSDSAPDKGFSANVGTVDNIDTINNFSDNELISEPSVNEDEVELTNKDIPLNSEPSSPDINISEIIPSLTEDQIIDTLKQVNDYIDYVELSMTYFDGCNAAKLRFILDHLVQRGICETDPLDAAKYRLTQGKNL